MKRVLFLITLIGLGIGAALSGCGDNAPPAAAADEPLRLLASTYPVYDFTAQVIRGAQGVELELMIEQEISCVHDYSLSANDMSAIERADALIISGAGLESFLLSSIPEGKELIDSSGGIELLPLGHDHDDHDGHDDHGDYDPHIWLDPENAVLMTNNICQALCGLDPDNREIYLQNAETYGTELLDIKVDLGLRLAGLKNRQLITFHDGFSYFAKAFDLEILRAIEEEPGSGASAAELAELVALVKANELPSIFTEVNGSTVSAEIIARETGAGVFALDMIMSGSTDISDYDIYCYKLTENVNTILEALS